METNIQKIKARLAKLTIGGTGISIGHEDNAHWRAVHSHWNSSEGSLSKLEIQHQARLILGNLAADTSWLPFGWPIKIGHLNQPDSYQSPRLVIYSKDTPEWLPRFLADAIPLLQLALNATADAVPDRYLRDAYELYNKLTAELLQRKSLGGTAHKALMNAYFIDIRFANATLWPLLEQAVDDGALIAVHTGLFQDVMAGKNNPRRGNAYRKWLEQAETWGGPFDAEEYLSRYQSGIRSFLEPEWFKKDTPRPTHPGYAKFLFRNANQYLEGVHLGALVVSTVLDRYPDPEMDESLCSFVRFCALGKGQSLSDDGWHYQQVHSNESVIDAIEDRFKHLQFFKQDKELQAALSKYKARRDHQITKRVKKSA